MTAALAEKPKAERTRTVPLLEVRTVGSALEWKERGDCYGDNDDTMYPETKAEVKLAVLRCQLLCPVQELCLAYGIETDQRYGIWGGTTEGDRARLKRRPAQ